MNPFNRIALLAIAAALAGCVSIADVDISNVEPTCARQCTATYSTCVSSGQPVIGTPTALYYQCKQALNLCASTCPRKP